MRPCGKNMAKHLPKYHGKGIMMVIAFSIWTKKQGEELRWGKDKDDKEKV